MQAKTYHFTIGDYGKLKEVVVTLHEKSKPEILDELMSFSTLTGRPSVYLNELISLTTKIVVSSEIIRHEFIQAMPINIRPDLEVQMDLVTEKT